MKSNLSIIFLPVLLVSYSITVAKPNVVKLLPCVFF